jgi:hypothetical protein
VKKDVKNKIKEIIGELNCPKNFSCTKHEFKHLCKGKDIGLDSFLECQEKDTSNCVFSVSYGQSRYCSCPLRVYLAKKLEK